jgi:hypothetical protein
MPNLYLPLHSLIQTGLRPRTEQRMNQPGLTNCLNFQVEEEGLRQPKLPTNPFSSSVGLGTALVQHPQVMLGSSKTILVSENAATVTFSEVTTSATEEWTATGLTTYSLDGVNPLVLTPGGGNWHFADFGDFWFACNNTGTVFNKPKSVLAAGTDVLYATELLTSKTCCAHRGRLVTAGFNPNTFWTDQWNDALGAWAASAGLSVASVEGLKKNFVMWSSIGGGNALARYFQVDAQEGFGGFDTSRGASDPEWLDYWRRGDCGFMALPRFADVVAIKPLGQHVLVYCTECIVVLTAYSQPVSTYGIAKMATVGVMGRGCVAANGSEHLFIDTKGDLWRVDESLQFRKLGFQEMFYSWLGSYVSIHPVERTREYYLTNGSEGFVLTQQGLSELSVPPLLVFEGVYLGETLLGYYPTDGALTSCTLTTGVFDCGRHGLKQLREIEVRGSHANGALMSVVIDYREVSEGAFAQTEPVNLDDSGWAAINITGNEFKVTLSCDNYSGIAIDEVRLYFDPVDRRFARGIDASSPFARSGQ